ncbi:MAG: hypothetical protein ACRELD_11650 [Longimicrobiales bacterium]
MIMRSTIIIGVTLVLGSAPLTGQAWDTPMFFPPNPPEDLGLYATKPEDSDWGLKGIWRQHGNPNLGVQAGLASIGQDNTAFLVGAEVFGPLGTLGTGPLTMTWVLGAGATFDDDATWLRVPVGLSLGAQLGSGGMRLIPYLLPRAALDVFAVDNAGSDTDVNVATDVGVDVHLTESFWVRAAASLWLVEGDVDLANAFGIGAAIRFGREVEVRGARAR